MWLREHVHQQRLRAVHADLTADSPGKRSRPAGAFWRRRCAGTGSGCKSGDRHVGWSRASGKDVDRVDQLGDKGHTQSGGEIFGNENRRLFL